MPGSALNVLLVTPVYPPPPGGIQTVVRNLELGLEEAGHTVEVLHLDPSDRRFSLKDLLPKPRWMYSVRATLTGQFVYQRALYRRAIERIEAFDPDVVHALHIRCWSALVAASELGVPTVLSAHALELEERALARRAAESASAVHAVSDFTASLVRDTVKDDLDVHRIYPLINVAEYRDAADDAGEEDLPSVVTMARFVDRKNIETVIDAWRDLRSSGVDGRLRVVGDGPNRESLERLAGDDESIEFLGWVTQAEKRELLARAKAFILVPRREEFDVEGFGIVYIEAQATGTAVIGSKRGGAPEAIDDAGIIVDDEDDPAEVAAALRTMLTDDAARERYETAARERVDRFDVPVITDQFVDLYESLAS